MGQCASSAAGPRVDITGAKYLSPKGQQQSGVVGEKAFSDVSAESVDSCGSNAGTMQAANSNSTDVIDITPPGAPDSSMIANMLNPESEAAMGLPYQVRTFAPASPPGTNHLWHISQPWDSPVVLSPCTNQSMHLSVVVTNPLHHTDVLCASGRRPSSHELRLLNPPPDPNILFQFLSRTCIPLASGYIADDFCKQNKSPSTVMQLNVVFLLYFFPFDPRGSLS